MWQSRQNVETKAKALDNTIPHAQVHAQVHAEVNFIDIAPVEDIKSLGKLAYQKSCRTCPPLWPRQQ
ncbi:2f240d9b-5972-4525-8ce4-59b88c03837c [Thermothielavioides terrestris]|uniref:2f240d9b-5972-4525-8ce4-59b88c03837c n=1 Tax=Thermothielavioides terrestris TaxID=2587410 RepID=A0A3S4F0Y8_9PEZI|nr:2f240d9b-5972-4525-8ce4-59b88c03837c [Thermothielavioides terrestris]